VKAKNNLKIAGHISIWWT